MTTIFDCETEIGRCDSQMVDYRTDKPPVNCLIYAHTSASLNGTGRMLKIEHRCFVRLGDEVPDQPWVKPEVALEPAIGAETDLVEMAKTIHRRFVSKARELIPEGSRLPEGQVVI